jgi:hypothetical protein
VSNIVWIGGAAAVAQQQTWVLSDTWEANDVIRVTVGQKVYDFTAGSTTIATIVTTLVAAYNALDSDDYPEFAEMTAEVGASSATFKLTADEAGVPFTATLTPLESDLSGSGTQLIEGGLIATTGTALVASAGPNDWSTAKNWSGGAVPGADSVYFENSDDDVKYGLAQSGVTLALLELRASFTGTIGLPLQNADATEYPEYRARHLAISATILNVGDGPGDGSGRLLINVGTNACTLTVYGTGGGPDEDQEALQWKGTHAANVVNVLAGEVAIAGFATETAVVATMRLGYEDSQDSDAVVRCGAGVTLTTITMNGGVLEINSAFTTLTKHAGSLTTLGGGAITTLNHHAGSWDFRSTGTVTTYIGGPGSTLSRTGEPRAVTITTTTLHAGATLADDGGVIVFTNGIVLSRCTLADVGLSLGWNRTVSVA